MGVGGALRFAWKMKWIGGGWRKASNVIKGGLIQEEGIAWGSPFQSELIIK